jgi:hypothetical protein
MPFVHDESEIEWPEDGTEPGPPRPEEFVYIPAPQFGGPPAPVRFAMPSRDGRAAPQHAAEPDAGRPPQARPTQKDGLWQRILRWFGSGPPRSQSRVTEDLARRRREAEERQEGVLSVMVPALRNIGARRVYCRYDGGNDEGFAWLDSVELESGERIAPDALAQRLHEAHVHERLRAAGHVLHSLPSEDRNAASEQGALGFFVDGWLCNEWASALLGGAFGTGAFSMYGAFTVDLETGIIADDSHAAPVVQNIIIAQ